MTWRSRRCFLADRNLVCAPKLAFWCSLRMCMRLGDRPCSQSRAPVAAAFASRCPILILLDPHPIFPGSLRTLKARCSRKCAVPLVLSVSARLPASIHTPTVDVCAQGECSVAICNFLSSRKYQLSTSQPTVRPLASVVDSVLVPWLTAVANLFGLTALIAARLRSAC
jgi:hypothetical protein